MNFDSEDFDPLINESTLTDPDDAYDDFLSNAPYMGFNCSDSSYQGNDIEQSQTDDFQQPYLNDPHILESQIPSINSINNTLNPYIPQMRIDTTSNSSYNIQRSPYNFRKQLFGKNKPHIKSLNKTLSIRGRALRVKLNAIFMKNVKSKNVLTKEYLIRIFNNISQPLSLAPVNRDEGRCLSLLFNNRASHSTKICNYVHRHFSEITASIDFESLKKRAESRIKKK